MKSEATSPRGDDRDDRNQRRRALLRAQPWGLLQTQLTAIALKRIRGRSLPDAQDFAQGAITDAYRAIDDGGWDPEKGPLMSFLVARVVSAAGNERRRKRNTCEVCLDEEVVREEEEESGKFEKFLAEDRPAPDEQLHRLRVAATFQELLLARLAGDEIALALLALMRDGLDTPRDLADAAGRTLEEVREARRRIRYHADRITKEQSAAAPAGGSGAKEVMQ
jgi:hypothetical protein